MTLISFSIVSNHLFFGLPLFPSTFIFITILYFSLYFSVEGDVCEFGKIKHFLQVFEGDKEVKLS
jgi:hypothetical protein